MTDLKLKRGKEESLLRFHPWVFSGAISSVPAGLSEGDTVRVLSHDGNVLGTGHYEIGSIAVRMFSWADEPLDQRFYFDRLSSALSLRRKLGLVKDGSQAYRLCHGEGDFLPGCVIDIYGDTAVFQAHSVGIHNARNLIADALVSLGYPNVYYKSDTTLPYKAQEHLHLDASLSSFIRGGFTTDVAMENGLKFHIDWLKGQKTGFFVDQRDNRSLLERFSHSARVLNMFCYTGGFSVYAMRGGAELVHSVDSSAKAIALTDENIALNFPGDPRHTSYVRDAFDYLQRMEDGSYDLIVLDPPAFAKHRQAIPQALRGYRKLNAAAIAKIAPGGVIFTFSCSQAITPEQFRLAVFTAAASTGRKVRILHRLSQPADHPVNIYHPEGEYLKGLVIEVE